MAMTITLTIDPDGCVEVEVSGVTATCGRLRRAVVDTLGKSRNTFDAVQAVGEDEGTSMTNVTPMRVMFDGAGQLVDLAGAKMRRLRYNPCSPFYR